MSVSKSFLLGLPEFGGMGWCGVVGNGVNFAEFWVSLGQEFGKTFLWV
jgi:hypothetical protein